MIAAWWAGIIVVGALLPLTDHALAAALKRTPLEIDLLRNLRYVFLLLLLSVFYLLSELRGTVLKNKSACLRPWLASGVVFLTVGLMFAWMGRYRFFENPVFRQTMRCWGSGHLLCPPPDEDRIVHRVGMLRAIRSLTPAGSRILGSDMSFRGARRNSLGSDFEDLAIRYYSLRPLAFTHKDGGALSYANHKELAAWWRQFHDLGKVKKLKERIRFLDALAAYAKNIRTDFLVLPGTYNPKAYYPACLFNIYSNPSYSIFKVVT